MVRIQLIQSISNRKKTAMISLESTHEFLCVKVSSGETPPFSGIIKFNEPLEKLSDRLPDQAFTKNPPPKRKHQFLKNIKK